MRTRCSMAKLRSGRQGQRYRRSAVGGPTWRRAEYVGRNTAINMAKIRNFGAVKSHVSKLPIKLVQCRRSILTSPGLDDPGSKAGGSKRFPPPIPDQSGPGVYPAFCTRCTGVLPEQDVARAWCWSPPPPQGCMSATLFCLVLRL